jgi:DNA-binding transcriptional LysR family regulator
MEVNYLNLLGYFKTLAKFANYIKAAEHHKISYSGMVKAMKSLETKLGTKLFKKSRLGMVLTPEGKVFLDHVEIIFQDIQNAELAIQKKQRAQPLSEITILTTPSLAGEFLIHVFKDLKNIYPSLKINMFASFEEYSLDQERFDVYVGPKITNFTGFSVRKLLDFNFRFYATEEYKKKYGLPKNINELKKHRFIHYSAENNLFFGKIGNCVENFPASGGMVTNFYLTELQLVKSGEAIGLIADELIHIHKVKGIDVFPELKPFPIETVMQYKNTINKEYIDKVFQVLLNSMKKNL